METFVNALLDNIASVLWRIAQFPVVFQIFLWLIALAVFLFVVTLGIRLLVKRPLNARTLITAWSTAALISLIFVLLIIFDAREIIRQEETLLREGDSIPVAPVADSKAAQLPEKIETIGAMQWQMIYDTTGVRVVQGICTDGPHFVTIAEVDLRAVKIHMDTACSVKERTSKFAKEFNCAVAINGEAGTRPSMDAPLGQWIGNYIIEGFPIYLEDSKRRPFLCFDKQNHGRYSPEAEEINEVDSTMFNTMWGRFDLLCNGAISISTHDGTREIPFPRTLMGIDSSGHKLILAIVDGRQPKRSVGMTMEQCGHLMLAFGSHDAMACDQGGSSCMYIHPLGIVNKPSDGGERAVYTHFGVELIHD